MSFDVQCQCGALCDKTELGACVDGVYVTCHYCETEEETEAREDREAAELRDVIHRAEARRLAS